MVVSPGNDKMLFKTNMEVRLSSRFVPSLVDNFKILPGLFLEHRLFPK